MFATGIVEVTDVVFVVVVVFNVKVTGNPDDEFVVVIFAVNIVGVVFVVVVVFNV